MGTLYNDINCLLHTNRLYQLGSVSVKLAPYNPQTKQDATLPKTVHKRFLLFSSQLRIQFVIQPNENEGKRKIKLRCNADIYKIYQRTVGKTVDIETKRHKTTHKTTTTTTTTDLPEIDEPYYKTTTTDDEDELSSVWDFICNCSNVIVGFLLKWICFSEFWYKQRTQIKL